ncbi:hypothetical protein HUT16_16590 [Kitasatospora sp. NA04385]|uniref:hypothetical protein n=1 Tax=Kitasatospora sp. NA04385 TaxID=2742135 RepID=UPI0015918682|nr:hypothetical protein [Kitasatospora sp. NA04385]QKW20470.1 hypothetical protein HUT16_16590 [Kitasatospora sp. NA04385]
MSETVPVSASAPVAESGPELTKPPLPEPEAAPAAPAAPTASRRSVRLPRRRGVRWVLGAAVAVVLGVAAVGAGVALERHHDRGGPGFGRAYAVQGPVRVPGLPDLPGLPELPELPGSTGQLVITDRDGSVRVLPGDGALPPGVTIRQDGPAGAGAAVGPDGRLAPAALPAVPADQALAKAAAAVPNGKVAALSVVGREGGGSSWSVEVLGADGVRHLVTVDGTDGSVTGNTTGTAAAGR